MEESVIWQNVKTISPIWPGAIVHTNPAPGKDTAVNASSITSKWESCRPVISRMMWNGPLTAPSVVSYPQKPEIHEK